MRVHTLTTSTNLFSLDKKDHPLMSSLQKGGVPAAPSGTATLLRLSPSHRFYPRPILNGYGLQVPPAPMA